MKSTGASSAPSTPAGDHLEAAGAVERLVDLRGLPGVGGLEDVGVAQRALGGEPRGEAAAHAEHTAAAAAAQRDVERRAVGHDVARGAVVELLLEHDALALGAAAERPHRDPGGHLVGRGRGTHAAGLVARELAAAVEEADLADELLQAVEIDPAMPVASTAAITTAVSSSIPRYVEDACPASPSRVMPRSPSMS